jgi:hypothetical protein
MPLIEQELQGTIPSNSLGFNKRSNKVGNI